MHPSFNICEGVTVGDWEGENDARCPLIVGLCDVLEPLLPSSIPNLQFVPFPLYCDWFDFEVYPDGGHIGLFELILAESGDEVGLSDPTVPDDDDFSHAVVLVGLCLFHYRIAIIITIYYTTLIKMDNEYRTHEEEEIKQARSIITNINPED